MQHIETAPRGMWSTLLDWIRPFTRLTDRYYFMTAVIIAQNSVTRQYRDSFLGIIWTILQPAVQIIVYAAIFSRISRASSYSARSHAVMMTGVPSGMPRTWPGRSTW